LVLRRHFFEGLWPTHVFLSGPTARPHQRRLPVAGDVPHLESEKAPPIRNELQRVGAVQAAGPRVAPIRFLFPCARKGASRTGASEACPHLDANRTPASSPQPTDPGGILAVASRCARPDQKGLDRPRTRCTMPASASRARAGLSVYSASSQMCGSRVLSPWRRAAIGPIHTKKLQWRSLIEMVTTTSIRSGDDQRYQPRSTN
jgi:hypothetical protein